MFDLHIHTLYSDGKDSAEDTVLFAIKNGIEKIGFSEHSYTFFDERGCGTMKNPAPYKKGISKLKERYKDKIEILCGIEQDYFSRKKAKGYDYIIGSVHYVLKDGEYFAVDDTAEVLRKATEKHYGGDAYALCEDYFRAVAKVVEKTGADIIGHFDLIAKFNEKDKLFDEKNPRYVKAWKKAVDALLKTGKPFEINTGAMSRGYKTQPYPSKDIREYIKSKGGKFILSSDSHKKETLAYKFADYISET